MTQSDISSSDHANGDSANGYDPAAVEAKWQALWRERGTNQADLTGQTGDRPFYQLMMFPYPSAEGLHVGNLFAFAGTDIHGRFQRMQGHSVFEPFGYDAFGIHSENYALKMGVHPGTLIPQNITNFRRQLDRAGLMVDWRQQVDTTSPSYYRWTQWVFLQLYKKGLAYKKKAAVNWCPADKTVLANEQVIAGACERCGTMVEQRALEQWFFRISEYAPRLLANLDTLDWSPATLTAQRNWIGRSEGAALKFPVTDSAGVVPPSAMQIEVFTTRPDTIFGATYLVLAPEHPLLDEITTPDQASAVSSYREASSRRDVVARKVNKEKSGVFIGAYAHNAATGQNIPIWVADYVLMEYGTGAIMAVPGHDERDFEFAQRFSLPIVRVVAGADETENTPLVEAFTDNSSGRLVNSGPFNEMSVAEAKGAVTAWLADKGAGRTVTNYRLHDWCISRQRYWGPPIPMIYCESCGVVPVPEDQLPVLLPHIEDYRPDDSGVSPLARHEEWYRTPCPKCAKLARRETDVSDVFLDSAWYFLRYPSATNHEVPFEAEVTRRWLPVDSYIGGNEHAVLHLLYARFVTMVLHDMGYLDFEEPFTRFRAHGMIIREGAKMSKSRGNVVNPDEFYEKWGADAFRTYLMFLGPYEEGGDFRDAGISGVRRFLDRLWLAVAEQNVTGTPDETVVRKLHQTIAKVTRDVPALSYNTAIAALMEYMNTMRAGGRAPHRSEVEPVVQMIAPFAPHIAEELWERLGNSGSVFDGGWPVFDETLTRENTVQYAVQINGKTRGTVTAAVDATQDDVVALVMAESSIAKFVTGPARKTIFVKGRLLNLVV